MKELWLALGVTWLWIAWRASRPGFMVQYDVPALLFAGAMASAIELLVWAAIRRGKR